MSESCSVLTIDPAPLTPDSPAIQRPWKAVNVGKGYYIKAADGNVILGEVKLRKAEAELICRAVNNHERLVDACKEALEFIETRTPRLVLDVKDSLRIAIKRAEEPNV